MKREFRPIVSSVVLQPPSLGTLLFCLFLYLKLAGIVSWPWFWVLSPIWIPVVVLLVFLLVVFLGLVAWTITHRRR